MRRKVYSKGIRNYLSQIKPIDKYEVPPLQFQDEDSGEEMLGYVPKIPLKREQKTFKDAAANTTEVIQP